MGNIQRKNVPGYYQEIIFKGTHGGPFHSLPLSPPSLRLPLPAPRFLRSRYHLFQLGGLEERYKLPQRDLGQSPSQNRFWYILAFNLTPGGNNFNAFPENQLLNFYKDTQFNI